MAIQVRPKIGPVNFVAVMAVAFGTVAWWAKPSEGDWWQWWVIWVLFSLGSIVAGATALSALIKDYRLRRNLALSETASDDHGSSRQATSAEIAARQMYGAEHGDLLGLDDRG